MIVGFTGTRHGMTDDQKMALREWLSRDDVKRFHHGDCVGADAEAHAIAVELDIPVALHPPAENRYRAGCGGSFHTLYEPKSYLARNRDIVEACDVLVACPDTQDERQRSGTWSTVRHARRVGKPRVVFLP